MKRTLSVLFLLLLLASCSPPVGTRGTVCNKEYIPPNSWTEIRMNYDSDGDFTGTTLVPHNDPEKFVIYLCYETEDGKKHSTSLYTYESNWTGIQIGARFESTENGIVFTNSLRSIVYALLNSL